MLVIRKGNPLFKKWQTTDKSLDPLTNERDKVQEDICVKKPEKLKLSPHFVFNMGINERIIPWENHSSASE